MKKLLFVAVLFIGSANAATIVYSAPGVVTGIGDLDIGGTLYNVDFEVNVFSTFGGVEDFWGTQDEAVAASVAINTILNAETSSVLVNGITGSNTLGDVYQVQYGTFSDAVNAFTFPPLGWVIVNCCGTYANNTGTAWSVVPIPAAVWLFGSGLGLLGWMRRRQTA